MLKLLAAAVVLAAAATLLTLYLREPQIGGSRAATEPQIPGCASLRVFNGSQEAHGPLKIITFWCV